MLEQHEARQTCPQCRISIPVVDGFPLWNERFIDPAAARDRVDQIRGGSERYLSLLEHKRERRLYEPYAWFRPFNESTRALEPFRDLLIATVEPGAPILDLWCRTGWTGELLASWFPENPVVSIWEGDHDHLGYQGYRHWLQAHDRAPNLSIVFADANEPLPFATDWFGLVHGLDTLHRYSPNPLIGECLRVARPSAPIMFPHIHLTNSEPDPFFERGCTQLHGAVWGDFLDGLCEGTDRRAWVLSERDLYLLNEPTLLADQRDTSHYNGFVALGPRHWQGAELRVPTLSAAETDFVLANPLLSVDSVTGRAAIDREALSGTVGHMIDRHPVALEALRPVLRRTLTSFECQVMTHAVTIPSVGELSDRLGLPAAELIERCADLLDAKALQIESVSPAMAHLQSHYRSLRPAQRPTFGSLWASLPLRYEQRAVLRGGDDSTFDARDVDALVQATRHWLHDQGVTAGDRVGTIAGNHVEYCIFVWAAWLSGVTVIPLSPELSTAAVVEALKTMEIRAVACDAPNQERVEALVGSIPLLVFDDEEEDQAGPSVFAEVIGDRLDRTPLESADFPGHVGAVVYTSGSSGEPKPVELSMRSLLHTGAIMADVLTLRTDDQVLSLAPTHTMSGLRNPHVAALTAGATVVATAAGTDSALGIAEACRHHNITVLVTSPAAIDRFATLADRLRPNDVRRLRLIATTADRLDPEAARTVAEHLDVEVVDYYGLTETGGICVAQSGDCEGTLGRPIGASVEVHSKDERAAIGTTGELRVSGPGVMTGYAGATTGVRHEAGWVYTGDLGVAHDDGSISLLGRTNEQMKRRNGEIYPHLGVIEALQARADVERVTVRIEPATRELVVEVATTGAMDAGEVSQWLVSECGIESVPDQLIIEPRVP